MRTRCLVTALVLFLSFTVVATAETQDERPRVGVLAIENATGDDVFDALADTIRETVKLSLLLLDRYEVVDENVPRSDDPSEQAAALPADTLLWGEVSLTEAGQPEITVSIFDRLQDSVVLTESEVSPSLLDVFDTADSLVGQVIGAFSGIRVGFGTIRFEVSGDGSYRVFLDDTVMGEDVTVIERVLSGEYTLRVEQELPDGVHTVLEEPIVLEDESTLSVSLSLLEFDLVRAEELQAIERELETLLLDAPTGPGTALNELYRLLARYETYDPDPSVAEWYRYRIDLEQEYREILDYRYFKDSFAQFDSDLPEDLLTTTLELNREPSGTGVTDDQRAVLLSSARRNYRAFYGIMLLAADYQTVLGNIEEQTLPYRILFSLDSEGLSPLEHTSSRPQMELSASSETARQYTAAIERQRPLWHNLLIGAGAAGVATAGLVFGTGMPWDRLEKGDDAYDAYQATTDPDEAVRLREETEDYYQEANLLFIAGGSAGLLGVSAITTGIIARVRSVRRPQRIVDAYLDHVGERRLDAAISFFEDGDADRVVLVRGPRESGIGTARRLQLDDQPFIVENGPAVYRDVPVGTDLAWTGLGDEEVTSEHRMHPGRNVMFVP